MSHPTSPPPSDGPGRPPALPLRSRVEHAVHPALERLNRVPRFALGLAVLALLVAGILVPHVGWVATALVALLVAGLVWVTWPQCRPPERLMRLAVLGVVVAMTVVQAVPRG